MTVFSADHYDLMAMFEKEFSGFRLDREPKKFWPGGNVYQSGETNNMFIAYRKGAAYGRAAD